jgi:CRISPR-associated protein Csb2
MCGTPQFLCVSVTFLQPTFHGRRERGVPEWPPSPLRVFQALVAAAAARWDRVEHLAPMQAALRWLELLSPPQIVAPVGIPSSPYVISVPNNAMDLVASAWCRGNTTGKDAQPATHRTMKTVRPTRLSGGDTVHYLWALEREDSVTNDPHIARITAAARSIVALGWGIDVAIGDARLLSASEAAQLAGQRWHVRARGQELRVPDDGTLDALVRRHDAFVKRLAHGCLTPVPPLDRFRVVCYAREAAVPPRPFAAFALRPVDPTSRSPWRAFRAERAAIVAAMLRHAACRAAQADQGHWDPVPGGSNIYVAGHTRDDPSLRRGRTPPRFSYLALPSIGARHADGMIRRVLIAEPFDGDGQHADWAAARLSGADLVDEERGPVATLERLDEHDPGERVLPRFTGRSREWISATPVVLPGYDGLKVEKAGKLLSLACDQAGLPPGCVESFEFVGPPAHAGTVGRWFVPSYLRKWPLRWARLVFKEEAAGPIALGAGRHCGLGVFAMFSGE